VARRSGRRPGDSGTRDAIRTAAGRQFAEQGYDRTSMRSIAGEAGVDPALVAHFFGTKHELFVDVVELPFDPGQVLPVIFAGDRQHVGRRLADFLLTALENPEARRRMTG
jgi:AcrR family transcriptional regulator